MCDCYIKVDTTIPTNSKPKPFLLLLFQSVKASKARKKIVFIKKASNNAPKTDKKSSFWGSCNIVMIIMKALINFFFKFLFKPVAPKE